MYATCGSDADVPGVPPAHLAVARPGLHSGHPALAHTGVPQLLLPLLLLLAALALRPP